MLIDLYSFVIVAVGIGVLVLLAVLVGQVDSASRAAAWRRIAAARRELWAERHNLGCRGDAECADCPFRTA